jgi:DNA-binding YbaB/EbfC family protein
MMGGNMAGMMKKMQQLQADMGKLQEDIKTRVIEVSAGGGAVKVEVTGEKKIKSVKIAPSAVDPEDVEMLEDLVTAAINEAMDKVDDMMAKEMGKLTGGLNLPPGLF